MPRQPGSHDKGQYRFDETGKITVVASKAHERGPKPVQADMDTLMHDLENAAAWGYDLELPHDITDDKP